jgi:hypothetical protein
MEMDSWQFWDAVEEGIKKGTTVLKCVKCGYIANYWKRGPNVFKSCPKCKGDVRLHYKEKKKRRI